MLMRQAVTNLLQNAVEAMPHGGELRISVKTQERENAGGEAVREIALSVRDTGVGIPPAQLEKIFLPFFTTKEKGTGMGLALVHKIILSHNGRIEAQSAEGQGTTFYIYLPLQ
jgi:signal transduction histidine kinase